MGGRASPVAKARADGGNEDSRSVGDTAVPLRHGGRLRRARIAAGQP